METVLRTPVLQEDEICFTSMDTIFKPVMRIQLNYYTDPDPDPGSGNPPYKSGSGSGSGSGSWIRIWIQEKTSQNSIFPNFVEKTYLPI